MRRRDEGNCGCTPPEGLYCNRLDPSFCAGSACSGDCYYDETYRYAGACWCSATCQYEWRRVWLLPVLRLQLLRAAVRLPGVHLDRLQRTVPADPTEGGPPVPPPGNTPALPPGFGDDAPQLPPGVPSCFPFCD